MKEISRQAILITIDASPVVSPPVQVGVIKLFAREGDGGMFYKAFLWENFETELERAAQASAGKLIVTMRKQ